MNFLFASLASASFFARSRLWFVIAEIFRAVSSELVIRLDCEEGFSVETAGKVLFPGDRGLVRVSARCRSSLTADWARRRDRMLVNLKLNETARLPHPEHRPKERKIARRCELRRAVLDGVGTTGHPFSKHCSYIRRDFF